MAGKRPATIGIDIGGTKTLVALFDGKFRVVHQVKFRTRADRSFKLFRASLEEAAHAVMAEADRADCAVAAVGCGCAGVIDADAGVIRVSPNIPFLEGFKLGEALTTMTGAPSRITHDVQAGLHGEYALGAAKGLRHVLGIFIGTGIGGALIVDGKMHHGLNGLAGDIGRFIVSPMGPLSGAERWGVLDDVASRTAIAAEAATLAVKRWAPALLASAGADVSQIRSGALCRSIEAGDERVEELVRSRSRLLGITLSNVVNFLAPEMLVLGGGLVEAMPQLITREVQKGLRDHLIPGLADAIKVVPARLAEHAVTAGAAHLALEHAMSSTTRNAA